MLRRRRWVNPVTHRIDKFFPDVPPRRGDIVLVDGQRCRVLKAKVRWEGTTWDLDGMKVVSAALAEPEEK